MGKLQKHFLYLVGFHYTHNSVDYHKQVLIDATSITSAIKELTKTYGKTYDITRIAGITEAIPYEYTK